MIKKVDKCFWCKSEDLAPVAKRKDGNGVQECQNCKLLQVTHIPEDLSEYYDEEAYFNPSNDTETGYHENYDLISPFYLYWQGALVEEIARFAKFKSVMEVGCATGNAMEMIRHFSGDLRLKGIDLSSYAIKICLDKGLDAEVSTITGLKSQSNFDIIFSSETMEHVDDLREFVRAAKGKLETNGAYVFYVPAVDRKELIAQGPAYVSLTTSLEHVSYFTQTFLEKAMLEEFDEPVIVKQVTTAGESYAIGIVSHNRELIAYMGKFIDGFSSYDTEINAPDTLYNLTVIAGKFACFNAADKYLAKLSSQEYSKDRLNFLQGLIAYNKGELIKAKKFFEKSLGQKAADGFILRVFLALEKEFNLMNQSEISQLRLLEPRVAKAEEAIQELRNSKIVSSAIYIRKALRRVIRLAVHQKKKLGNKVRSVRRLLVPFWLRRAYMNLVTLKWLERRRYISNVLFDPGSPLVSVVIPYYNRANTIDETLMSLQAQTFIGFDVILVDDGSTHLPSIKKLNNLNVGDLAINVVRRGNGGVAAARNTGIEQSRAKYIICLDSDDVLDPTYLEKCVTVLESDPDASLVTVDTRNFGLVNSVYKQEPYNANHLLTNNMVVTAAMFKRDGWVAVGGYKSDLGYEDWEYWINLSENGFWGRYIPEAIFHYRTALSSRYVEDKLSHKLNIQKIYKFHRRYLSNVKKLRSRRRFSQDSLIVDTAFINLDKPALFHQPDNSHLNILVTIPWMTFGGAETLIYNYCREIKNNFNITFVTGLSSAHEWEYKFREITPNIFHLANLFDSAELHLEFVANYIATRNIDVLHIIHNGYTFKMLPELKRRFPELKVITTMFNDRVEYFKDSIGYNDYIDTYVTDNAAVADHFRAKVAPETCVKVIPNGINCYQEFSPNAFNRNRERAALGLNEADLAVFFVGRLSVEKNPDVFVRVAKKMLAAHDKRIKFLVIGDGPMRSDIEQAINETADPSLVYLGYQSEVASYLSAADVFVLPSSIEGFPLSILEAMAMRVAVVASDVGAVADVLENGKDGFVVKPGSVEEIVTALRLLESDRKLLESFKNTSRVTAEEKYSNTILGQNYTSLYHGMVRLSGGEVAHKREK